jgi:hypothetical protein
MKKYILILSLLLFPAEAFAAGCGCGSIQAMIRVSQMQTTQTVNAFTAAEAEAIRSEILLAAQNIIGTIKTESATIVRAIVGLKESNAAIIKGQAAASEAMKTEDLYGKASQPAGLCGASSVGAGLQLGAQAAADVHGAMREKQREYGNREGARPVEHLERITNPDHPDAKAMTEAMYPLQDTLTEEQVAEAHEAIKTLTNPRPLPVVTQAQKETPAGQTYAAARLIHEGRISVVTETLNNHVVTHAPTLPDEVTTWAQNQWSEAGGSGTPPGLVDGKLSEAGLFKLLSQMRIGNPNWFVQVTSATDAGLLRELVMMQALQLELTRKNNELLDRIAVTASMDFLTRMEGTDGKAMSDLYTRMIGTQQ